MVLPHPPLAQKKYPKHKFPPHPPPKKKTQILLSPSPSPSLSQRKKFITLCFLLSEQCDGASPACSTCNAVYKTTCAYDFDGDHRRKNALKRDIEQLKEKNDSLEEKNGSCDFIVAAMRSASDSEVGDIVNHIREHGSLADIATSIKESRPGPLTQSLETDLSDMVDQFRVSIEGELGYGQSWCDESSSPRENRIHSGPWTKVTSDPGFITELLVSRWAAIQPPKERRTNETTADFVFHVEPSELCLVLEVVLLGRHAGEAAKILQFTPGKRHLRTGESFFGPTRG